MRGIATASIGILACAAGTWLLLPGAGVAAGGTPADLSERLADASRPAADRERDAGRKPAAVVAFLGIGPGMRVIDLIAAGGWYTEVLSLAVGDDGVVYAQNPEAVLKFRDGANDRALTQRLAGDRLPNVKRVDARVAESGIAPGSLDAAITALNFHDVHHGRGSDAAAAFLEAVYALLRPGGVLGIIDHVGVGGADDPELHRIEPDVAIAAARAAGFELEARSDLLRNPEDDHTKSVFDASIRGHTDRFLLRLRKPATDG